MNSLGASPPDTSVTISAMAARAALVETLRQPDAALSRRRERELVRAARRGSDDAIERIYRSHWPMAYRTAYLVAHDAAAAEDIAQEAFLSALRSLDRFDLRRPFGPWLHRIVVNRAIDWTRRRNLRAEVALGDERTGGSAAGPGDAIGSDIVAVLAGLPPDQRAIVVLRHLLGYTPGEIAKMLDLPRGTVNSRMRRALDRVRAALEPGGVDA